LPLVEAQAESRFSCCFGGAVLESLGELLFRINLFQKSCEKQAGERFMSCMSFPIGLTSSGKWQGVEWSIREEESWKRA
jgi:hypothetical protein